MISLLDPKCTSAETVSRLKKFSCVGEMTNSIYEEFKDKIALIDS